MQSSILKRPSTTSASPSSIIHTKRINSTASPDTNNIQFDNLSLMVEGALASLDAILQAELDAPIKTALSILQTTMKVAETNLASIKNDFFTKSAEEMERQRSLVLIGLPEQNDPKPQTRARLDEEAVEDVLNQLGVESRPVATYRLGRPPTLNPAGKGGPRLIKIVLPASVFQRIALSQWKKRRDEIRRTPQYNRLLVRPSLTLEQRLKEREERSKRMADRLGDIAAVMNENDPKTKSDFF